MGTSVVDASGTDKAPAAGVYELLMTDELEAALGALRDAGGIVVDQRVGDDASSQVLSRHLAHALIRALGSLSPEARVPAANRILDVIRDLDRVGSTPAKIVEGPRQLISIAEQEAPGVYRIRPATPLSETALFTNSPDDPSLGYELRAELESADRVDLLCAFVKWHGLRVLEQSLRSVHERGVPIRVITTTYIGATERRALDRLVKEFGAEVKVNYETKSTRLHAKAWLFRRKSGFDTAYVGSSNLSKSALLDGLEWNVRLSSVATPEVLHKFEAAFDSYWNDSAFEMYDPAADAQRLDDALHAAGRSDFGDAGFSLALSGLEVRPYPHQKEMLEDLDVEREVHDNHRNLLVAATGTGKTVIAALDYKQLRAQHGRDLSLLFVAHRKEILAQSMRAYREVLGDATFGEMLVDGKRPDQWRHVFASVQSLTPKTLESLQPDQFDVVVIDEFHHATAPTYRRVIDHFHGLELLGLTATPERMDGKDVHDEYFDGRIASELRLWDALEADLLCPFHYFGVSDNTDLTAIRWKGGSYDQDALSELYVGNKERVLYVLKAIEDKVANPDGMRALGFCVTVAHAEYMAREFNAAGLNAMALSGGSSKEQRAQALADLRAGKLQVIFSVDLFNEGLDIPHVDTLLLLRPTSSATVFLQQLGRGLRRSPDKAVLTVLDFIGQQRKEFRFESRFRALTGVRRHLLQTHVENDFPHLPTGCEIILDRVAKHIVIENLQSQLGLTVSKLALEVKSYGELSFAKFLRESQREISELYVSKRSWTDLLRRAGLVEPSLVDGEAKLLERIRAFLHVDDRRRVDAYTYLLSDDVPPYAQLTEEQQLYAQMLFYNIWPNGGATFAAYEEGLETLRPCRTFRAELRDVLQFGLAQAAHVPIAMSGSLQDLPLAMHAYYTREELLTALKWSSMERMPGKWVAGVAWSDAVAADALLITSKKDEKDFSPQTLYKDYAISPKLFHWESQNSTSPETETGRRYITHEQLGTRVLLFIREAKSTAAGAGAPYMLLGPARYIEHAGARPMSVTWELAVPMPTSVFQSSRIVSG
ncbi:DUF3427 domain-containing protein [Streptodolium elevatio]|uniref:DUF3427 domain-containing protein n=1 Tax=Streptodolium elevatio TaxID=3157996 RepID=UPI003F4D015C